MTNDYKRYLTTAIAYLGFGGLLVALYHPDPATRTHGERGFTLFVLEVIGVIVFDILRSRWGWPGYTWAVLVLGIAGVHIAFVMKAIPARRRVNAK